MDQDVCIMGLNPGPLYTMVCLPGTDKELCQQIAANDYHHLPGSASEREQRNPSVPDYGLAQLNALVKNPGFSCFIFITSQGLPCNNALKLFSKRSLWTCRQDQCWKKEQGKIVYYKKNYSIVNNTEGKAAEALNGISIILLIRDNGWGRRMTDYKWAELWGLKKKTESAFLLAYSSCPVLGRLVPCWVYLAILLH